MEFTLQLSFTHPQTGEAIIESIAVLDKSDEQLEDLGLTLAESKHVLGQLQQQIVALQTSHYVEQHHKCPCCGKAYRKKGSYPITYRTLFGDIKLTSPRFYYCACASSPTEQYIAKTFSPLHNLLVEHMAPERLYLESKWGALLSYHGATQLLKDVLPLSETYNAVSLRNHLVKIAQREENMLGEEQFMFAEGCQRDWNQLPFPEGPITIGLDGGYLRRWDEKKRYFEVIAGKSVPQDREVKYFGFVDNYTKAKPKRRLFETLRSQGMQMNQTLEFFSDGADNLINLQRYLNPLSEHYLDWFHITMRITVLNQYIKGWLQTCSNQDQQQEAEYVQKQLASTKWYLWHGNAKKALDRLNDVVCRVTYREEVPPYMHWKRFSKTLEEFEGYISNHQYHITNYGERYRYGETITSSFVESTINQIVARRFCKKQQMQWSKKGAHLLLVMRSKVFNKELRECFLQWYPNLKIESEELRQAA